MTDYGTCAGRDGLVREPTIRSNRKAPEGSILTNEFAQVRLTIDRLGNDARLEIEDLSTNLSIALDAFVLVARFRRGPDPTHGS